MKYVIVTGASGGMGRATILKLLSEGYFVIGLDIINNDDVKNYKYQQFKCDITNELEVIAFLIRYVPLLIELMELSILQENIQ